MDNSDRLSQLVCLASLLVMENEKEGRRASRERPISAAATLRFARSGGGTVRYMKANQVRDFQPRNANRFPQQAIDGRGLCWSRRCTARSPST